MNDLMLTKFVSTKTRHRSCVCVLRSKSLSQTRRFNVCIFKNNMYLHSLFQYCNIVLSTADL